MLQHPRNPFPFSNKLSFAPWLQDHETVFFLLLKYQQTLLHRSENVLNNEMKGGIFQNCLREQKNSSPRQWKRTGSLHHLGSLCWDVIAGNFQAVPCQLRVFLGILYPCSRLLDYFHSGFGGASSAFVQLFCDSVCPQAIQVVVRLAKTITELKR